MKEIILMRIFLLFATMLLIGCSDGVDDNRHLDKEEVIDSAAHHIDPTVEGVSQIVETAQSIPLVFGGVLIGDFNGDQLRDTLQKISQGRLTGYLVLLSGHKEADTLGLGRGHEALFNDFSWVDSSRIVGPGVFEEVTFSEEGDVLGSREVEVKFDAVELLASDIGGGILAWNKDKGWFWIHQTD